MLLLTACSKNEEEQEGSRSSATIELLPCAPNFFEEEPTTRAWTPPTGYSLSSDLFENQNQENLRGRSIGIFFTQNDREPQQGVFSKNSNGKWTSSIDIETSGNYFLYGFIPNEVVAASLTPNTTYSEGTVMTLNLTSSVTPNDVCIVVGAKDGTADSDNGLRTGLFETSLNSTKGEGDHSNYIYLLFDHLYSAICFKFKVDNEYNKLRTIEMTRLELRACTDNTYSKGIKAQYTATVTLKKNDRGESPIESIVFAQDMTSVDIGYTPIFDGAVTLNPDTPTPFTGCLVPGESYHFQLRSTYNVYDKQGNCIREGCQAVNSFDLRDIYNNPDILLRGHLYPVLLTVKPTYLYVLSEPDLDNPTIQLK